MSAATEYKAAIDRAAYRLAKWPQLGIDAHDLVADAWLRANDLDAHEHRKAARSIDRAKMVSRDAMLREIGTAAPDIEDMLDCRLAAIDGIEYASAPRARTPEAIARANAKRRETERKQFARAATPASASAQIAAFCYALDKTRTDLAREIHRIGPKAAAKCSLNFRGSGVSAATYFRNLAKTRNNAG